VSWANRHVCSRPVAAYLERETSHSSASSIFGSIAGEKNFLSAPAPSAAQHRTGLRSDNRRVRLGSENAVWPTANESFRGCPEGGEGTKACGAVDEWMNARPRKARVSTAVLVGGWAEARAVCRTRPAYPVASFKERWARWCGGACASILSVSRDLYDATGLQLSTCSTGRRKEASRAERPRVLRAFGSTRRADDCSHCVLGLGAVPDCVWRSLRESYTRLLSDCACLLVVRVGGRALSSLFCSCAWLSFSMS
jgi:hypothetical protein